MFATFFADRADDIDTKVHALAHGIVDDSFKRSRRYTVVKLGVRDVSTFSNVMEFFFVIDFVNRT